MAENETRTARKNAKPVQPPAVNAEPATVGGKVSSDRGDIVAGLRDILESSHVNAAVEQQILTLLGEEGDGLEDDRSRLVRQAQEAAADSEREQAFARHDSPSATGL